MAVKYPVLETEIKRRGMMKKAIAARLNIDPRSLNNKLNGVSHFSWEEANAVRDNFFPDMDLQKLMTRRDGA